ncbi:MAG: flagellar biosynthetic protein FliQ [Hydrogenophilales bacterium CG03_land_8_20_14_0_80_62_28]|nr:flagellar biosynthesis protein FliQ [Betaproteobacteria bacterium]OIO79297.1 MAG: EscS/YscS/HrcS family type III secretion system export apparatus protein [Hydrogenophilaceae bacterium CG1_02_62_390]PIV23280.1 MAG: flagellar biosynthetic protein FliQ [Hydrogenophilales bacterium CG03_land_8_20_14_0_80_62_28]PIW39016.1 MAG: flagellar biosynthetic protein FliQ [Hydrogenophilales bacterium CG15_BIG_FIL_POST_REV_8_21_14_020_62_31]PIW70780.1 MAG: flagellar biosynthetic protein FliQ [Hydrogenophil
MTPETVIAIVRQALEMAMLTAGPLLLASLATGLLISIFQAATQINEMTLTFIPKLVVMFLVLVVLGPWMLSLMVDYVVRLYGSIPTLIG